MNGLRLMRFRRGLTIGQVAEGAGIARPTVTTAETADDLTSYLTASTAKRLADFYRVPVEVILGLEPDPFGTDGETDEKAAA